MSIKSKIIIGVATVGLVGTGVGVGVAYADPGTPSPSASPTSKPTGKPTAGPSTERDGTKAGHHRKRSLERRALHGEATLAGDQHQVIVFQRGTITRVDGTKVTVKSADGFSATYVATSATKIKQAKQDVVVSAISVSTKVAVMASKDGSTLTAKRIVLAAH